MFRQRLRLPSHLRCTTTKDFREAAETLLFKEPYTIPERQKDTTAIRITSYSPLRCSFLFFFFFSYTSSLPLHLAHTSIIRGASFRGGRPSFEEILIPSLTIKFFQPSYLRRYSNLSSPYEVNLILPSFSVFISFQESLAIRLRSPISLETESQTKRKKKKKLLLKSIFRRSRSGNKYHQGKGNNEFFLRFHEIEKFIIVRRTIIPRRIFPRSLFTTG